MPKGYDLTYRILFWVAIATFAAVVGVTGYQYITGADDGGALEYRRGNLRLEDGKYREALTEFETVLKGFPQHAPSFLGKGLALMQLSRFNEALEAFDTAIAIAPNFGAVFANRGILKDKMGQHAQAIDDYTMALKLEPELGDGPGWITRFFRLQVDRPPSIADRARYLKRELAKPVEKRKLRVPEEDKKQRSYKFEGILGDKN